MSRSRRITKTLFASGLQCAKRLYLDVQDPDDIPAPSLRRQALVEIGIKLVELARTAFPVSETADPDDFEAAVKQTETWLAEKKQVPVFDAAFAIDDLEARADIAIPDGTGGIDIYEVKSGNKVKTRHLRDLAFQMHVIAKCGYEVKHAWILHLSPQYRHRGGVNYPVHELFKHVEVTTKARRQAHKTADYVASFKSVLDDPGTLELPTGTWCNLPFTCGYLPRCREEGPEHPLLDLPDLSREQETELHQEGIEDLTQIDPEREGLTLVQRRAVRSIQEGGLVVESFVERELRDVDFPLHFIDASSLLQVLPVFENSRPWQHIPYQWNDTIVSEDGVVRHQQFTTDGKSDPRSDFARTLAEIVKTDGTLMVWGPTLEQRLRDLLDDLPEQKPEVRAILNHSRFDLRQLVRAGVYHPDFQGSFELQRIYQTLGSGTGAADLDLQTNDEAQAACQRMFAPRTRATTKDKLSRQLQAYGQRCSTAIQEIYDALISATES